jgi:A/G-specific adenine glycosylase
MSEMIQVNNHTLPITSLHASLLAWDAQYRRSFPWRTTTNPFHIMMAELMLRRTQARQVVHVYKTFIEHYPDPYTLAMASADEVALSLFSLGLSWRVPAFQQVARILVEQHNGIVPPSYDTLLTLPGIGDYVASAVCCFAFGQPVIIVDTNTVRVAGRLFGLPTHAESRRRKPVRTLLQSLLDEQQPQAYNYALLDLAALICTSTKPKCTTCPLQAYCFTGKRHVICQNG